MNQPVPEFLQAAQAASNTALMARRHNALPRGVSQSHTVFISHARNAEIWDVEGRRHIDFAGGIAVLNTGHSHSEITAAVQRQVEQFSHTCFQVVAYESYVELAEKLNAMAPGAAPKKTMLLTTGAEAVENAVKIARAHTGRPGIIAFGGGFHGRTNLTMGLTGKVAPYKLGFGPFPGEIYHARYPNALHGVSVEQALESVRALFKYDIEPERTAAFILEPVQGEGGFYAAPPEFIAGLKAIADAHGILLIADEVQTGAGRTGTWYACEQWSVVPDLITTAKSLAGGYPLAAVTGRADIMDAPAPGGLGGTYAGNPVAVAAALAVLRVFEQEQLLERGRMVGERLRAGLRAMAARHPAMVDVRGPGAMVAFELGQDGDVHQPDADAAKRIVAEAAARGLILLSCGSYGNVIRILVPLTVPTAVLDEGLELLAASVAAALT
ncbi:MAG: 4-aminobutyrate--2-oxoglutarate transaminase [Acidovorax sp.]|jgi:4-aminobutyrate aminotransferase/(S)-3-amino-2-methylpropionate transaminase|nr:4-aminobutyrate--2-oxoglutarate transaminase [Acidovorax sp.]